jgi:hypothetical protein
VAEGQGDPWSPPRSQYYACLILGALASARMVLAAVAQRTRALPYWRAGGSSESLSRPALPLATSRLWRGFISSSSHAATVDTPPVAALLARAHHNYSATAAGFVLGHPRSSEKERRPGGQESYSQWGM